jgi:MYXO-CTERM domain-containing protein
MNARATMVRWSFLAGLACLLAAGKARATSCVNDIDCPGNAACGGDVCNYATGVPTCAPAGTGAKGQDGWCDSTHGNADCKCASLGATCTSMAVFCTFTKPSDAPSGGAGSSGSAGTTGSAGSTGSAGTTGTSGTSGGGGGGCSVAGSGSSGGMLAFAAVGLVVASIRRRRRARA